jgi:hypothetical protein
MAWHTRDTVDFDRADVAEQYARLIAEALEVGAAVCPRSTDHPGRVVSVR